MSKFTCEYCKKQFVANFTLRRHVRQFHKNADLPEVRRGRKPKTCNDTFITCVICSEKLANKRALNYHRKRKHEQAYSEKRRQSERIALKFENLTDFNHWKCHEEDATMTQFVKAGGDTKRCKQTVTARTYYCNRSGRYIAKDGRLRHLKKQGTCKIGRMCPAAMFVKIFSTGAVTVSYYPEHKGHSCDIAHIRLRREQREAIAVKLAAGIPFDDVLDSFRSTPIVSGMTKLQFLRKQDLTNITRDFGINKEDILHRNDASISDISGHRPSHNIQYFISNAELAWASIRTAMEDNIAVAEMVSEHMSRLRSLVAALQNQSETPRLPPAPPRSHEPVNKLVTTQQSFRSTRKPKPKEREFTASKPSVQERASALNFRCNEPVISHQLLSNRVS